MKLNAFSIALTFAGCFLGAGFVSGQELWQFFASYGVKGLFGLVLAMTLLFGFGILLMGLSRASGRSECDSLIIRADNIFLRSFVGIAAVFFLIGVAVIMSSGVGALFEQQWNIPHAVSSVIFCLIVFFLSLGGHKRMVKVFSVTVPVLAVFTVMVAIFAYICFPISNAVASPVNSEGTNPLLGSWWISAVTFVAYNLFSSIEILAPLGKNTSDNRNMIIGILMGSGLLLLIALSIFFSMYVFPDAVNKELPMLYVAESVSPILSFVYAMLLFLGMLGTALSSVVGAVHFLCEKSMFFKRNRIVFSGIMSVIIFLFGLFGFGDLIGTIYPVCGYLGIIALVCMVEHFIHLTVKGRKND